MSVTLGLDSKVPGTQGGWGQSMGLSVIEGWVRDNFKNLRSHFPKDSTLSD